MKKAFKKIFIPIVIAMLLLCNEYMGEYSLITSCIEIAYGKTNYEPINSYDSWYRYMKAAKENLMPQVSVSIDKFNQDLYDINKLAEYNISIKASGEIIGRRAYIDYTFEYSDNYKLLRAVENPGLTHRLNTQQQQALLKLREIKSQIIKNHMSDYEGEKAIHDFMVTNYKYDQENLNAGTLTNRSHSVVGLVNDKKGVCEAYANTFMLLCKLSEIECQLVTGTVDNIKHAWNIVKLDNEYYHVDVTNDDPIPDTPEEIRYAYFNLDDNEISKTHIIDLGQTIKCTGKKYNYYTYNNLIVTNFNELKALTSKQLAGNNKIITFKTQGFILNSSTYIQRALEYKGFTKLAIYGEFGADGVFYVKLS